MLEKEERYDPKCLPVIIMIVGFIGDAFRLSIVLLLLFFNKYTLLELLLKVT